MVYGRLVAVGLLAVKRPTDGAGAPETDGCRDVGKDGAGDTAAEMDSTILLVLTLNEPAILLSVSST